MAIAHETSLLVPFPTTFQSQLWELVTVMGTNLKQETGKQFKLGICICQLSDFSANRLGFSIPQHSKAGALGGSVG